MKKYPAAVALAAALIAPPAFSTSFPALTTIYVISGVADSAAGANAGVATSVACTNASGLSASMRFLVLNSAGTAVGSAVVAAAVHGRTVSVATHAVTFLLEDQLLSPGAPLNRGAIIVEATESAVFCTAEIVDASSLEPAFTISLHLVRVNPHPGTVE